MAKLRHQNPVPGDEVKLQIISYNSNYPADVVSVEDVKIYNIDGCEKNCPEQGRLVATIPGSEVSHDGVGKYSVIINTESPNFIVGEYADVWHLNLTGGQTGTTAKSFKLYTELWAFSTLPPVYSFDFQFQPNQIRKGSKKYIIIKIIPNIPRASDLEEFYYNLAVIGNLYISMDVACVDCSPVECGDLVINKELIDTREKCFGYYFIDTNNFECGLYNIWFDLEVGEVRETSKKFQLQIY